MNSGGGKDYMDEHAATKYAQIEIKKNMPTKGGQKAVGMWTLGYALDTYRKGWVKRGNPVVFDKDGTFTGGKAR